MFARPEKGQEKEDDADTVYIQPFTVIPSRRSQSNSDLIPFHLDAWPEVNGDGKLHGKQLRGDVFCSACLLLCT